MNGCVTGTSTFFFQCGNSRCPSCPEARSSDWQFSVCHDFLGVVVAGAIPTKASPGLVSYQHYGPYPRPQVTQELWRLKKIWWKLSSGQSEREMVSGMPNRGQSRVVYASCGSIDEHIWGFLGKGLKIHPGQMLGLISSVISILLYIYHITTMYIWHIGNSIS